MDAHNPDCLMHRFAEWAYTNISDVATKEIQNAELKYFFFARNNTLQTNNYVNRPFYSMVLSDLAF